MSKHLNESSTLLLQRAIEAGISSPKELSNLLGNADVETGGFSRMHENHHYRSAKSLESAVTSASKRFSHHEIEVAVASQDPKEVFKVMYEKRADLGNTEVGDGDKFHGRGYLQYTGRYNYTRYGDMFGVDLKNNPDLAAEPEMAAKLAIAFWKHEVPKNLRENVRESAKIINGGENGMDARVERAQQWSKVITPELIHQMQNNVKIEHKAHNTPYSQSSVSEKPIVDMAQLSPATQSLHADVSAKVQDLYTQHNQPIDQGTHNTAMQVTVALAKKGATGIERIAVKDGHIHTMQMRGEEAIIASVNTNEAANTPTDKSLSQLAAIDSTQSQMQANPTQNLNQSQSQGRSIA